MINAITAIFATLSNCTHNHKQGENAMAISYQETTQSQTTTEQNTPLSLGNLNKLLDSLTGEHLPYLEYQPANWYDQIVLVVLLPNGLPALQVKLDCPQCNGPVQTMYAVAGEYGAWATLLEANGSFLVDLCDADERSRVLICSKCRAHQKQNTIVDTAQITQDL